MARTLEEIKTELSESLGRQIEWLRSIQADLISGVYTSEAACKDLDDIATQGFNWMSLLGEVGYFEEEG